MNEKNKEDKRPEGIVRKPGQAPLKAKELREINSAIMQVAATMCQIDIDAYLLDIREARHVARDKDMNSWAKNTASGKFDLMERLACAAQSMRSAVIEFQELNSDKKPPDKSPIIIPGR